MKPFYMFNREMRLQVYSWQCGWPHELKNKSILEVRENQWMHKEEPENCPAQCVCRKRCSDEIIVVNCEGKSLAEAPSFRRLLFHFFLIKFYVTNKKGNLDNKSRIRRFAIYYRCMFLLVACISTRPAGSSKYLRAREKYIDTVHTIKTDIKYEILRRQEVQFIFRQNILISFKIFSIQY